MLRVVFRFTIERYIGICHPLLAKYICTVKRAIIIILLIWLFSLIYNSPWLWFVSLLPMNDNGLESVHQCTFNRHRNELVYKLMYILDICFFYLMPLLLSLILYSKMALALLHDKHFSQIPRNIKNAQTKVSLACSRKKSAEYYRSVSFNTVRNRTQVMLF